MAATIELEVVTEAARAQAELAEVGEAARAMGREVDQASKVTADAAARMDDVSRSSRDLTDGLDRAAGGIDNTGQKAGDLESGFRGVTDSMSGFAQIAKGDVMGGLTDLAGGAEALAVGFSGVLIPALKRTRVYSVAAAAATKAQAAAMRVLNLVMRANPIGLVITAAVLLVGVFVALYQRSARFRSIVQAVGKAGRAALGWVVDQARNLVTWVGSRLPGGFGRLRSVALTVLRVITAPHRALITLVGNLVGWVSRNLPAAFNTLKAVGKSAIDALLTPFRALRDLVSSVKSAIGSIDFPDVPKAITGLLGRQVHHGGFGRPVAPATVVNYNITVSGVLDTDQAVAKLERMIDRRASRFGRP